MTAKPRPFALTPAEARSLATTGKATIRRPVGPGNSTVLGYAVRADSPVWSGLIWAHAVAWGMSPLAVALCGPDTAPPDFHLRVPWCHPEDKPEANSCDNASYRVRPRLNIGDVATCQARRRPRVVFEVVGVSAERDAGSPVGWAWVWEVEAAGGPVPAAEAAPLDEFAPESPR